MKAAAPNTPALEMHRVAVNALHDPTTLVIEDIDWRVAAGEFWVIGGLQGAGKSDFLFMAGGLMGPARGVYRLFGAEMPIFEEERLEERLQLGLVFDGGQLFNHLTIAENVALPLRYHRNLAKPGAADAVKQLLELTDLTEWADSTPGAIGRHWRKRAGLARALMLRPSVLLLDNPLAGLDLRHRGWWLNFLDQLARGHPALDGRPLTLVATADDLVPWRRASHFALLKDKRFTVLGSWEKLAAMTDEPVKELLAIAPGAAD